MAYRFRRKTLNLLLSALVLAWGIVPPGVQHAHVGGGDAAHRHDDFHEVAHHRSHDHDSDDEDHQHATVPDVSLLADYVVLHLHWQFLGLESSMPAPEEPADNDDHQGTMPPAIVRALNEEVLTTQADRSFSRVLLSGIYTPSADVVRNSEPVPRPPNLVTSIPLCDSARLERSGVLLA